MKCWLPFLTFLVFHTHSFAIVDDITVTSIQFKGNKKTKNTILKRETTIELGEKYSYQNLIKQTTQSKQNIFNTALFNFVYDSIFFSIDSLEAQIQFTVEERWYLWPMPIFDIAETNLNIWWKDKDWNYLNYGFFLFKDNMRGRRERLLLQFQNGYRQTYGLSYSFRNLGKQQQHGLSLNFSQDKGREINTNLRRNQFVRYRDPQQFISHEVIGNIKYSWRPKLFNTHQVEAGYNYNSINKIILEEQANYLLTGQTKTTYISLKYFFKHDKRNNNNYPLKGHYFDLSYAHHIFTSHNKQFTTIKTNFRKYGALTKKIYWASSIRGSYSSTKRPFSLLNGLGSGNEVVRGYEFYVVNGEHYLLQKNQLRYALLNKTIKLSDTFAKKFSKIPLALYLGIFNDNGYVWGGYLEENPLNEYFMQGIGVGLDIVSYYDMVFRVEYSQNHLLERGFFFQFLAPI